MISVLTRKNVFIVSLWFFINTIYLWYLWNVHFFVICLMLPVVPTGWPFSARCTHFELFSQLCIESACSLNLILLTWRIGWAHNNASRWHIGFNSAFKVLKDFVNRIFRRVCRIANFDFCFYMTVFPSVSLPVCPHVTTRHRLDKS